MLQAFEDFMRRHHLDRSQQLVSSSGYSAGRLRQSGTLPQSRRRKGRLRTRYPFYPNGGPNNTMPQLLGNQSGKDPRRRPPPERNDQKIVGELKTV